MTFYTCPETVIRAVPTPELIPVTMECAIENKQSFRGEKPETSDIVYWVATKVLKIIEQKKCQSSTYLVGFLTLKI